MLIYKSNISSPSIPTFPPTKAKISVASHFTKLIQIWSNVVQLQKPTTKTRKNLTCLWMQKMQEILKRSLYNRWNYDEVCIGEAIVLFLLHSEHRSNSINWVKHFSFFHTDLKYFSCFTSYLLFLHYIKLLYRFYSFLQSFFSSSWVLTTLTVSKQFTNINGFIILTFWYGEPELVQSLCTSCYEVERD